METRWKEWEGKEENKENRRIELKIERE